MFSRTPGTWMPLSVLTLCLSSPAALADVTWRGDFSGNTLNQYYQIQCGAYSGTAAGDGVANSGWCPYGQQNKTQLTNTTTNLCPNSEVSPTPPGDVVGCRFALTEPPAPSSYFAYRPAGAALRVRVGKDPDSSNGDSAPALGSPWGGDFRSEVVSPKIGTASKTFLPDEDVYFGFNAFVPGTTEFAAPGAETNGAYWHTLLQFHSEGECGSPNLEVSITRSDTATRKAKGEDYIFSLNNVGFYPGNSTRLWPTQEQTGLTRERWHQFVLRVKWSTSACNNGTGSASCNWSAPNGGMIELWQNGTRVYQGAHATLFNFNPDPLACPQDKGKSGLMATYMKHGLYRQRLIPSAENIYVNGLRTGSSYDDVDPVSRNLPMPTATRVYGVAANKKDDADGAVFVGGSTTGSLQGTAQGGTDAYLRRIKADGTTAWTVQQGMSSTADDSVRAVAYSPFDNTVVVAGESKGSLYGVTNSGATVFLAKYNQTNGSMIWGKMLLRSYPGQTIRGLAVHPSNGKILLGGATLEYGNHSTTASYLARFDASGNQEFYSTPSYYSSPQPAGNYGIQAVHYSASGDAYIAANNGGTASAANRIYIARLDFSTIPVWSTTIAPPSGWISVEGIATNGHGQLLAVGTTTGQVDGSTNPTDPNAFVISFNSGVGATGGVKNWARQDATPYYDGQDDRIESSATGITVDNQGIAYVSGSTFDYISSTGMANIHRVDKQGNRRPAYLSSPAYGGAERYDCVDFGGNHVFAGGASAAGGLLRRH